MEYRQRNSLLMVEPEAEAREFEKYVKSRPQGLLIHLRFDILKEQHREIYDKVSSSPTNFKICDEQAESLKEAAKILVSRSVEQLRQDPYWRSVIDANGEKRIDEMISQGRGSMPSFFMQVQRSVATPRPHARETGKPCCEQEQRHRFGNGGGGIGGSEIIVNK